MNEYEQLMTTLSLTMGVAWASGINLYAAILVLGLGGMTGYVEVPESLAMLQDPLVVGAAGVMYMVEFFADKVPGVDTGWDTLHTFIRIPAGAMLAASSVGDVGAGMQIAAGMIGGGITSVTHAGKTGSRVMINTSPEPVTNWTASVAEDLSVIGGLWLALNHPVLFIIALVAFIALLIWLLPKLWRAIKLVFNKIGQWLGISEPNPELELAAAGGPGLTANQSADSPSTGGSAGTTKNGDQLAQLERLSALKDKGALTEEEFQAAKAKLLG